MAPEIIIMFAKGDWSVDGYTDAIDWWSLGVTIYKLLVGRQPFARVSFEELQFIFPGVVAKQKTFEDAFTVVFGQLSFDNLDVELDAETKDFITKLLTFDAKHRLGVTYDGDNEHVVLKAHPFFKDINWEQLERREVVPPYDPSVDELLDSMVAVKKEEIESVKQSSSFRFSLSAKISTTTDKYTFEDVLRYYNKHAWIPESEETINDGNSREKGSQYASKASKFRLTEEQQFYFREWQYVNPNIIDEEKIVSAGRSAKNAMKRMIFG